MSDGLKPGRTALATLSLAWRLRRLIACHAAAPLGLFLLLYGAAGAGGSDLVIYCLLIVFAAFFTRMLVAIHRAALLGELEVSPRRLLPDAGDFGYFVALVPFTAAGAVAERLIEGLTASGDAVGAAIGAVFWLAFAYVSLRFMLALPMVATERKGAFMSSWRMTEGHGLRIAVVVILLFLSLFAFSAALIGASFGSAIAFATPALGEIGAAIVAATLYVGGAATFACALSCLYLALRQNEGARQPGQSEPASG